MKEINVGQDYIISINEDFSKLSEYIVQLGIFKRKICIVTDSKVNTLYLDEIKSLIVKSDNVVCTFTFEEGEKNKTLETAKDLYINLIKNHFDRYDYIFALGGGVVGDLAGYTAATYLRGIRFIQIPTTLLAMVDSSIGGKTGVDIEAYKNMVGAFHQPRFVYMNTRTLDTLDTRVFYSGMGEIIKHTLIRDSAMFDFIYNEYASIRNRDYSVLDEVIDNSVNIKRCIVEADPKERNERALLNFGHTIGHAFEKYADFKFYHGECVAAGCIMASYISFIRGMITGEEYHRIIDIFDAFDMINLFRECEYSEEDFSQIIKYTKLDKKMDSDHIKFILLKKIGTAYIDNTVSDDEMYAALREFFGKVVRNKS